MTKVKVEKTEVNKEVKDDIGLDKEEENNEEEVLTAEEILERIKNRNKKEEKEAAKELVSYEFGVIGCGHAGSRIAESFYKLGYEAIALNTATQDLTHIDIPEENKLFLDIGIQGAARDLTRGENAAAQYREDIHDRIDKHLGSSSIIVLCSSMGGGSGAGSLSTVIELLQGVGKPIIVLAILPMVSEDVTAKSNSLETLSKLSQYAADGRIHNLIVVDNARIEAIYEGVSQMEFYSVANKAIVEPLDVFNKFSMKSSAVKPLDSAEFGTLLLNGEGLGIYGQVIVKNYEDEIAISAAVFDGLESNLLASGFNLKEAKYLGFMVIANSDVWKKIPAGAVNYAATMADETFGNPILFRGIYESDDKEDVVRVYSFATGLGLPKSRIDGLKKDVAVQQAVIKTKDEDRKKKLVLETEKDTTVSDVDKIKKRITSRKQGFGKLNEMVVDRRRR